MLTRRRLWLVGLAILAIGFSGCDWTMVGYDAANTYSTPDTSLNSTNVPDLVLAFSANTGGDVVGSPIVAGGVLYADSINTSSSTVSLEAFDAAGNTKCSGAMCQPLWTAPLGSGTVGASDTGGSSPAVVNGVVYAGASNGLEAFDASGKTNCSGRPKTCAPLWSASVGPVGTSSPIVANGVVYIGSTDDNLYAFDAGGVTNCSGTPKTCGPLWSAKTGGAIDGAPAVANGVAYVGSTDDNLYAFDAGGVTNCSGTPKTCSPLWSAATAGAIEVSPAVANGVIYVGTDRAFSPMTTSTPSTPPASPTARGRPGPAARSGSMKWRAWRWARQSWPTGTSTRARRFTYRGATWRPSTHRATPTVRGHPRSAHRCGPAPRTSGRQSPTAWCTSPHQQVPSRWLRSRSTTRRGSLSQAGSPPLIPSGRPLSRTGWSTSVRPEASTRPLHTQVLVPSNGSSVSGTTILDASATPGVTLLPPAPPGSGVQFVLSGGSLSDQVVGTATPTLYGWIADWDTTTVPNGTYTLQSVATATTTFDTSVTVMSPGITVTVNNSGP